MPELGNFDATQVPPQESFDPMPPGEYKAYIETSSMETNSANTGQYLKLTWVIVEGQYEKRKVFQNLNLLNPNPKAVEIAQRELSAICHGAGKMRIKDSSELHNTPMIIKLKIEPAKGNYPAGNKIAAVKSLAAATPPAGNVSPAAAPAFQPQQPPPSTRPQAAANAPPWKR